MRGGEKVLEEICRIFPNAPIHTLVSDPPRLSEFLRDRQIRCSPLQLIPGAAKHYKKMLPLFGLAVSAISVHPETRLLISSDASLIKGIHAPSGSTHICYCHSPPRYLWDMSQTYIEQSAELGGSGKWLFRRVIKPLQRFDSRAAARVTRFIANSNFVRERIRQFYQRDADLIHPPVEVESFEASRPRQNFYLLVSELVPYKRVDLAVRAFAHVNRRLIIVGDGSERQALERLASANVTFLGRQPFEKLKDLYETCLAFLYPQVEDFGITAVEAQAAGAPVIALGKGGILDSVLPNETGLFFDEQTPQALATAVYDFERSGPWDARVCRNNAVRFTTARFREQFLGVLAAEGFA